MFPSTSIEGPEPPTAPSHHTSDLLYHITTFSNRDHHTPPVLSTPTPWLHHKQRYHCSVPSFAKPKRWTITIFDFTPSVELALDFKPIARWQGKRSSIACLLPLGANDTCFVLRLWCFVGRCVIGVGIIKIDIHLCSQPIAALSPDIQNFDFGKSRAVVYIFNTFLFISYTNILHFLCH